MMYYEGDTYYWYCENCDKRWNTDPEEHYCYDCRNEDIKAKIKPFTREDWAAAKAELQMESIKENE